MCLCHSFKCSDFFQSIKELRETNPGIKSTVRKSVVPDLTICIRDSGMDVTRVNIPGDIVRSDPETSIFMDQIGLWIGPSTTLAIVPVRRGTSTFHILCYKNSFLYQETNGSWGLTVVMRETKIQQKKWEKAGNKISSCSKSALETLLQQSRRYYHTSRKQRSGR